MKLAPLRAKWKDGFTIVELLIVIVIIGILAALIIGNLWRYPAAGE